MSLLELFIKEKKDYQAEVASRINSVVEETILFLTQNLVELVRSDYSHVILRSSLPGDKTKIINNQCNCHSYQGPISDYRRESSLDAIFSDRLSLFELSEIFYFSKEMEAIAERLIKEGLIVGFSDDGKQMYLIVQTKY